MEGEESKNIYKEASQEESKSVKRNVRGARELVEINSERICWDCLSCPTLCGECSRCSLCLGEECWNSWGFSWCVPASLPLVVVVTVLFLECECGL